MWVPREKKTARTPLQVEQDLISLSVCRCLNVEVLILLLDGFRVNSWSVDGRWEKPLVMDAQIFDDVTSAGGFNTRDGFPWVLVWSGFSLLPGSKKICYTQPTNGQYPPNIRLWGTWTWIELFKPWKRNPPSLPKKLLIGVLAKPVEACSYIAYLLESLHNQIFCFT